MHKIQLVCVVLYLVATIQVFSQGADMPFLMYEAENGVLDGGATIREMSFLPSTPTVELESSGRKCVELRNIGESISFKSATDVNTIVVRLSLPDSATGGGVLDSLNLYIDGVYRQSIVCTSKYAWVYGINAMVDNNPATGTPKRFYDLSRAFIKGDCVAAGSTITLRKDKNNNAAYYQVDFVLLENVGPPLLQPENTLSVVNFGATPNDESNDTQAFVDCIAACQSQKKGMWIPVGNFHTGGSIINAVGIHIYGAGMWYTTNTRIIGSRHKWNLTNCTIQDLYIFNPEIGRDVTLGHDSGMTIQGELGWSVQRVWTHHCFFWCSGTDGIIKDCRAMESWADGINLNNGPSVKRDYAGLRLTAQNNFIVGSGDDGIAINAQNGGGSSANMVDTKVLNNTSIGVTWANGIRIAGGRNSTVQNNLITDPADGNGIRVGKFGTMGNDCESVLVADNLILRGCGIRTTYGQGGITVTDTATAIIQSNRIIDSHRLGIDVQRCNAFFISNKIINPGTLGVLIKSGSRGAATFTNNSVTNLKNGQVDFRNDAFSTFTVNSWGNSWQTTGIENTHSPENGISISPKVVAGNIFIRGITPNSAIKIVNMSGQLVLETKTSGLVDISRLIPGIYFLSLSDKKIVRFVKI